MSAPLLSDIPILGAGTSLTSIDWTAGALLLVDKPKGWTSFDVVNKLRYLLRTITGVKRIKVGHAGTLDPMATGLLIIAVGKATKTLAQLTLSDKSYSGRIRLGATTPSYDAETEEDEHFPLPVLSDEMLKETATSFHGALSQIPPIYSAIKKDGKALYKYARAGQKVELTPRPVHIHTLSISQIADDELAFVCSCSKGTYIRSLAHDIGRHLDSGAYLIELRRTQVGDYTIDHAWGMSTLVGVLQDAIEVIRSTK